MKAILLLVSALSLILLADAPEIPVREKPILIDTIIILPEPATQSQMSVEEALAKRRSRRDFADAPLTLPQLSQLLWAAQGRTDPRGFRTAPSAGALYPMELYLVVANVSDLDPGIYRYHVARHGLVPIRKGDLSQPLQQACLDQEHIGQAPLNIVIAGDYSRTAKKYGQRAQRYVNIEAGHVGQNIYLQAESLGLATCAVGAFKDSQIRSLLGTRLEPLYVMPVGVPAKAASSLDDE